MRALILAAALTAMVPTCVSAQVAPAPAAAAAPAPRETVAAVARAVRNVYFDPERGEQIAAGLEAEAASGAFDALTDPRDLAAALSARLRPLDPHFNVVYDPAGPGAARQPGTAPSAPRPRSDGPNPAEVRNNFGFRAVQILPGNVGYIDMRQFSNIRFDDPADPARRAADAALDFVADADAVIFDLRDNGGGAPSMVGYLTSAFTPPDADIYNVFHSRRGAQSEAPRAFRDAPRLTVPVYVLISGRTGSAGEAFPYTLQAAGRAVIVGEASGGAANPGGMVPVGGGFAVFVSGGSPRNPVTGGNWEGTGVLPDVAAPWAEALTVAHGLALEAVLADDPDRTDAAWALEALRAPALDLDLSVYAGTYGDLTVAVDGGRLQVTRGRRPPVVLQPLGDDTFSVVGDPARRYVFGRAPQGRVEVLDMTGVSAPVMRARRTD